MFASFFDSHYPSDVKLWRTITYLRSLVDFTSNTLILKRAKRTIGLTHLAAVTQNDRLVRESRVSYGRLLGMLQFSLMFPSKIQTLNEIREVVASVTLLTHISDVSSVTEDLDDSWTTHMLAAQQLYKTYAPAAVPAMTRLDEGLMRHVIMNGFFLAVAKRRTWNVDASYIAGLKSQGWTNLVPAFRRLPGLLEETDKALACAVDASSLLRIVAELQVIKERTAGLFPEVRYPPTMDSAAIHNLPVGAEEHLVMADSPTFPTLYAPMTKDGGSETFKVVLATFLQLTVDCTMLRIWYFRPETLGAVPESCPPNAEKTAYELASRLCKVSLSLTHSDKVTYVAMLRFCLLLARNVFEQQDRLPEMGWCDACLIANSLRMQRVRSTAAPTLCKLEDITPGLAAAGRYKVKFDSRCFVVRATQAPSMRLLQ